MQTHHLKQRHTRLERCHVDNTRHSTSVNLNLFRMERRLIDGENQFLQTGALISRQQFNNILAILLNFGKGIVETVATAFDIKQGIGFKHLLSRWLYYGSFRGARIICV